MLRCITVQSAENKLHHRRNICINPPTQAQGPSWERGWKEHKNQRMEERCGNAVLRLWNGCCLCSSCGYLHRTCMVSSQWKSQQVEGGGAHEVAGKMPEWPLVGSPRSSGWHDPQMPMGGTNWTLGSINKSVNYKMNMWNWEGNVLVGPGESLGWNEQWIWARSIAYMYKNFKS